MSFLAHLDQIGILGRDDHTQVYGLLEGAIRPDFLAHLEFHAPPHVSLWRTDIRPELERHAPYLCHIQPQSEFDAWLGSLQADIGLTVILSALALDRLAAHLRRFSKFDSDGRRFFLRLGEPGALNLYARSIATDADAVGKLFANGAIEEFYFHAPQAALSQRMQPLFEQKNVPPHRIDGCLMRFDANARETA